MNTLIFLLLLCVVFGLATWLLTTLPLPAPWGTAARAVLVIFAILVLLSVLFGGIAVPQIWVVR